MHINYLYLDIFPKCSNLKKNIVSHSSVIPWKWNLLSEIAPFWVSFGIRKNRTFGFGELFSDLYGYFHWASIHCTRKSRRTCSFARLPLYVGIAADGKPYCICYDNQHWAELIRSENRGFSWLESVSLFAF